MSHNYSYGPGPSTQRRAPPFPQPQRNPSASTVRQRPIVQIPPIPPGARPPINPSSPTALVDSLHNTRLNPHTQQGSLSRTRSAEPPGGSTTSPKRANGWLQRPLTHTQGQGQGSAKPWEGSAFTVGTHVSVDDLDWDWDSGYGGSSQGHQRGNEYDYGQGPSMSTVRRRERGAERRRAAMSDDSHMLRPNQGDWDHKRWGMDSETSFETASNAEQIGSGILADQMSEAESTMDKLALFRTSATTEFNEWAAVVPDEARQILSKDEIQRQSNIYELIQAERNFVVDIEIFLYIFRDGLLYANPPIIPNREKLQTFLQEVFFNAQEILSIHLELRDKLFERQQDQHPIIHSVADIYLKWLLERTEPYTRFQKHLPKSLNYHKTELRHNASYRNFFDNIPKVLTDLKNAGMDDSWVPRLQDQNRPTLEFLAASINKHDFKFLGDFNSRFSRIELQFKVLGKNTEKDHPDVSGDGAPIPIIISTVRQVLSVASVELETLQKRVDFENFCKKLHFRKGEIIDLDWYDNHRQMFMQGPLSRRTRRDVEWHGWSDLYVGLLDNYLVVTKDQTQPGREQYNVVSRPIPLDYLSLAKPLNAPAETRRPEGCIIRDKLLGDTIPMFPFTVYHVADPVQRRYTFYADSDPVRASWVSAIQEAKTIRDVYQNENKFFAVNPLSGRRFNTRTMLVPANTAARLDFLGQVLAAAPFSYDGENYLVFSTQSGIYMGQRHNPQGIQKAMRFSEVSYMAALQAFDKLVILANEVLYAYPFQALVRVWRREADMAELGSAGEKISRHRDSAVQFFRAGMCGGRMLVGYVTKSLLQVSLHVLEALSEPSQSPVTSARGLMSKLSTSSSREPHSHSFQQHGQTLSLPRDATDLVMLSKRLVVMCQSQVVILDPQDPSMKAYPVPDFMVNPSLEYGSAEAIANLKDRCSRSKALGMTLSRSKELMVVFEEFGCYVTKYGAPARQSAFVRWETRATSVAFRWPHALLFSPNYIEIRNVESGGLVQVVQGRDLRLLYSGPPYQGPVLAAMRGEDDARGKTDSVVELLETAPIEIEQEQQTDDTLWREWDM